MPNQHLVQRAKRLLTKYGYTFDVVERRLFHNVTRDFCGFADLLAFRSVDYTQFARDQLCLSSTDSFRGVLALQVCSYSTLQEHVRKLTLGAPAPALGAWLLSGNRCEVWAFPSPRDGSRKPPKFRQISYFPLSSEEPAFAVPNLSRSELEVLGYRQPANSR